MLMMVDEHGRVRGLLLVGGIAERARVKTASLESG